MLLTVSSELWEPENDRRKGGNPAGNRLSGRPQTLREILLHVRASQRRSELREEVAKLQSARKIRETRES